MGLRRDTVQSTSMGFYILPRADDKEATAYHKQRYVYKLKKYISRSTMHLVMDSRAYIMRREEMNN
jgi:hypothetical protein